MRKRTISVFIFASILCFKLSAAAGTYNVAILAIPNAEMYKILFKAIGDVTGNVFHVKVLPPARAADLIEQKQVDIQVPKIKGKNEAFNRALKYDFAEAKTGNTVAFVLYTSKSNPVDINNLKNGNTRGYRIGTDGANLSQFGFTTLFTKNAEQSLKMVESGRIDGYINSQNTGDAALRSLKLKNIRRQFWDNYEVSFTLQKGQAGGKLDKILADGLNKLRESGRLEQIIGEANRRGKYKDWQPQ